MPVLDFYETGAVGRNASCIRNQGSLGLGLRNQGLQGYNPKVVPLCLCMPSK